MKFERVFTILAAATSIGVTAVADQDTTITLSPADRRVETSTYGIGIDGCNVKEVRVAGEALVRTGKKQVFYTKDGETIEPNSLIDIVVNASCRGITTAEVGLDQLSGDEEQLPPPAPVAPGPQAPAAPTGELVAPGPQAPAASTDLVAPGPQAPAAENAHPAAPSDQQPGVPVAPGQAGMAQPGSYAARALNRGAVVQTPGRTSMHSFNRHSENVIERSGNTERHRRNVNNIGQDVSHTTNSGVTINRNTRMQSPNFRNGGTTGGTAGKGANAQQQMNYLSGHSFMNSMNGTQQSVFTDSFNTIDESVNEGNIGGSLTTNDTSHSYVNEGTIFEEPPQPPVQNVTRQTTVVQPTTTTYVQQPVQWYWTTPVAQPRAWFRRR